MDERIRKRTVRPSQKVKEWYRNAIEWSMRGTGIDLNVFAVNVGREEVIRTRDESNGAAKRMQSNVCLCPVRGRIPRTAPAAALRIHLGNCTPS